MKINFICFTLFLLLFTSCKKSSNTGSTSNTNSSNSTSAYGYLKVIRSFYSYNGNLIPEANTGIAYFFSNPPQISSQIQVGGVWVGSTKFRFQSLPKVYNDSTLLLQIIPTTWQIIGANSIPSFTYTNNDSLPGYSGHLLLPDSIDKTQPLTLNINGVSGANSIEVIITDGSSSSAPHQTTQFVFSVTANNMITIPASSISGMNSIANGQLQINILKENMQSISGKTFNFISQLTIDKLIKIK